MMPSGKDEPVILEAFAKYLHAADPALPASAVLARWLWERLTTPPETLTDRVLRSEIEMCKADTGSARGAEPSQTLTYSGRYSFVGTSESGKRLFKSLYDFASSYEQQKWSRWVHKVKATDFNKLYNND
jgi:hypothetical protein